MHSIVPIFFLHRLRTWSAFERSVTTPDYPARCWLCFPSTSRDALLVFGTVTTAAQMLPISNLSTQTCECWFVITTKSSFRIERHAQNKKPTKLQLSISYSEKARAIFPRKECAIFALPRLSFCKHDRTTFGATVSALTQPRIISLRWRKLLMTMSKNNCHLDLPSILTVDKEKWQKVRSCVCYIFGKCSFWL